MSYDLKQFYSDNLPYYYNIGQIMREIKKQHMPYYKTRHFTEDYLTNSVNTIHNIENLEEKLRKIIFNMYDVDRYNRKGIPLYSEKKIKFILEDAEDEKEDEHISLMAKMTSKLGLSKTRDLEIGINHKLLKEDHKLLKEAFIQHFYNPLLEKSKNVSTSETP